MRRFALVALALLVAGALSDGLASGAPASVARCEASTLSASFAHVRDSDATGHELYRLRIATHTDACVLPGNVTLQLLGANGADLPTRVFGAIRLNTVTSAGATIDLELSPDLYGRGEPASGRCEPVAYRLRVRTSVGTLVAPVRPPTPVCLHGAMAVISAGDVR